MVRLKRSTAKRVQKLGDLSDTWDSLLNALADFAEAQQDQWWEEHDDEDIPDDDEDPDEEPEIEIHDVGEMAS